MRKNPETVDVKVSKMLYTTHRFWCYIVLEQRRWDAFFCWPEASIWGWNTIISLLELFHWPDFLFHHQDNHAKRCSKGLFPEQGCCASSTAANLFSCILAMIKVCVACLCGGHDILQIFCGFSSFLKLQTAYLVWNIVSLVLLFVPVLGISLICLILLFHYVCIFSYYCHITAGENSGAPRIFP